MGLTGAAVDYSRMAAGRAKLQTALDAAVLAGAGSPAATRDTVAANVFANVLAGDSGLSATPSFSTMSDGAFRGTVSATIPVRFMQLFGRSSLTIAADTSAVPPPPEGVCLLTLDTGSRGLKLAGAATVDAPNCLADVKSTGNPAAEFAAGTTATLKRVCVEGVQVTEGNGPVANLQKSCTTASDPFAGTLPTPSTAGGTCGAHPPYNGVTTTFAPGVYCGNYSFTNSTVHLNAGLYVVRSGDFIFSGGVLDCTNCTGGAGVTLYLADKDSTIVFKGGATATLAAPTTGIYAGILLFEPAGLPKTPYSIQDTTEALTLEGLVYLPSRDMKFKNSTSISGGKLTMVLSKAEFNASQWTLDQYETKTIPPASQAGGGGAQALNSRRAYLRY